MSRVAKYIPNNLDATSRNLVSGQPDFIEITTPSTTVELEVPHGLGRVPNGYVVVKRTYTGTAFDHGDSGTTWTRNHLYLRFSITSITLTIAVF
jgi:hypothetical protein